MNGWGIAGAAGGGALLGAAAGAGLTNWLMNRKKDNDNDQRTQIVHTQPAPPITYAQPITYTQQAQPIVYAQPRVPQPTLQPVNIHTNNTNTNINNFEMPWSPNWPQTTTGATPARVYAYPANSYPTNYNNSNYASLANRLQLMPNTQPRPWPITDQPSQNIYDNRQNIYDNRQQINAEQIVFINGAPWPVQIISEPNQTFAQNQEPIFFIV